MKMFKLQKNQGFGMVEVIVVSAIAAISVVGFGAVARTSLALLREEKARMEASLLVEEGFEGVRALRDSSWTANVSTLANDTTYFLATTTVSSLSTWVILTAPQPPINGKYYRTLQFQAVNRDASDRIAAAGAADPGTRKLTVTVSWSSRNATSSVDSSGYITNFMQN